MKRILFYSENFCGETTKGGLEVATFRIAKALKDSGQWQVYNACRKKWDGKEKSVYEGVVALSTSDKKFESKLKEFITDHEIDVVVNMSRFFRHRFIVRASRRSGRDVKIVFMQHFAPGSEMKKATFSSGMHLLKLNPFNPLYWLRVTFYPLLRMPRMKKFPKVYESTYTSSHKTILLSEGYKRDYAKIAGISDESKFIAIPNIFELEEKPDPTGNKVEGQDYGSSLLAGKQKRVLILSRMDEIQKRISLALKIWSEIEKDPSLSDWHLDIVGSGHNTDILKRLIKKFELKRITYHGWKERDSFLKESAILMSTSEYEGLPLSILEAQAYGCVPIAFDSYASLRDVIEDDSNGVVVEKFGDIKSFVRKLSRLMKDNKKREEMADRATLNSRKYSSEKIGERWLKVLNEL